MWRYQLPAQKAIIVQAPRQLEDVLHRSKCIWHITILSSFSMVMSAFLINHATLTLPICIPTNNRHVALDVLFWVRCMLSGIHLEYPGYTRISAASLRLEEKVRIFSLKLGDFSSLRTPLFCVLALSRALSNPISFFTQEVTQQGQIVKPPFFVNDGEICCMS